MATPSQSTVLFVHLLISILAFSATKADLVIGSDLSFVIEEAIATATRLPSPAPFHPSLQRTQELLSLSSFLLPPNSSKPSIEAHPKRNSSNATSISSKKNILKMNPQVSVESQEKIESFKLIEIKAGDFESFGSFTVEEKQEMSGSAVDFIKVEESFQIFEVKAENQVKFDNFTSISKTLTNLQYSLMENDDLVPPEEEILPSDHFGQQTPMETQLLDRPKKPPLQEIPPRGVSDQENYSHENPSNTLVKPTAYRAHAWLYDILGDRQNDTDGRGDSVFQNLYKAQAIQNDQLLHKNSKLNISLLNLVILYDEARRNCKKGKVLQDLGANIKILADPEWFTNERSSLSEENKIWRENREALDANLNELISMLKIASASDTPVRNNTSTLSLGETIAEELKPYATELNEFENYVGRLTGNRQALDANIEKLITMLKITVKLEPFPDTPDRCDAFTINAETMAEEIKPHAAELEAITNSIRSKQFETQKKKIFWAWLSDVATVVAAASMAYVARQYRM